MMRAIPIVVSGLLLLAPPVHAQAPEAHLSEVEITWGVSIPTRDGTQLAAVIYRPSDQAEALPVILGFTPYIANVYHSRAMYFARRGYVFAVVDVRGRGNSEGEFEPFRNEGPDGYDVVEWLARQPWSNGKIGMFGGSYGGFDQWAILKEGAPHLVSVIPAASGHPGVDFPFVNNVFPSYVATWLTLTSGTTGQMNLFGDASYWTERFRKRYLEHRPFAELDRITGNTSTHFQTWMAHPEPDAYWDAMVPTPDQYATIDVPILTITGHYDGDQRGAMRYYRDHMQNGPPGAAAKHYLVMGPWNHGGTSTSVGSVGGLEFGPRALVDLDSLRAQWYDWTLKDGPKPAFLEKRVAFYVAGADEWRYADSLPATHDETLTFYFDSKDGQPNDVFKSGVLSTNRATGAQPDRYVYDPLDVRPAEFETAELGNNLHHLFIGEQPLNETYAQNLFGNGLAYHTPRFETEAILSGKMKLTAWMSLDVPDTDFMVTVYEMTPDGRSIYLTGDIMRARYRESPREPKLVEPGAITRFEFDGFQFFTRQIAKGSRLRVVVTSPNSIWYQKNYNSGGVVAEETARDARTATITLYHDADHPTSLEVPVLTAGRPVS